MVFLGFSLRKYKNLVHGGIFMPWDGLKDGGASVAAKAKRYWYLIYKFLRHCGGMLNKNLVIQIKHFLSNSSRKMIVLTATQ